MKKEIEIGRKSLTRGEFGNFSYKGENVRKRRRELVIDTYSLTVYQVFSDTS